MTAVSPASPPRSQSGAGRRRGGARRRRRGSSRTRRRGWRGAGELERNLGGFLDTLHGDESVGAGGVVAAFLGGVHAPEEVAGVARAPREIRHEDVREGGLVGGIEEGAARAPGTRGVRAVQRTQEGRRGTRGPTSRARRPRGRPRRTRRRGRWPPPPPRRSGATPRGRRGARADGDPNRRRRGSRDPRRRRHPPGGRPRQGTKPRQPPGRQAAPYPPSPQPPRRAPSSSRGVRKRGRIRCGKFNERGYSSSATALFASVARGPTSRGAHWNESRAIYSPRRHAHTGARRVYARLSHRHRLLDPRPPPGRRRFRGSLRLARPVPNVFATRKRTAPARRSSRRSMPPPPPPRPLPGGRRPPRPLARAQPREGRRRCTPRWRGNRASVVSVCDTRSRDGGPSSGSFPSSSRGSSPGSSLISSPTSLPSPFLFPFRSRLMPRSSKLASPGRASGVCSPRTYAGSSRIHGMRPYIRRALCHVVSMTMRCVRGASPSPLSSPSSSLSLSPGMGVRGDLRNVRASGPGKRTPTPRSGRCGGLGTRSGIFVSYHTLVQSARTGSATMAEPKGRLRASLRSWRTVNASLLGIGSVPITSRTRPQTELGDAATPPAHLATVAVVGDGM